MSEHELWNELGNLYFLSGAYEQAIHSYTRSIALDRKYGRPFCNMALAYVQKGKCNEAIRLYEYGVDLLNDNHEKALTWSKLGDVYRHLKDYTSAVKAYEWADDLDPTVRLSLGSTNTADVLLNRRTVVDDVFVLADKDQHESRQADELQPASPFNLDLPPFLEELTPWDFDMQMPPPEESALTPFFEKQFVDEFGTKDVDEGVISTEPLQWKPESSDGESISVQSFSAELDMADPEEVDSHSISESDEMAERDEVNIESETSEVDLNADASLEAETDIDVDAETESEIEFEADSQFGEIADTTTEDEMQSDVEIEVEPGFENEPAAESPVNEIDVTTAEVEIQSESEVETETKNEPETEIADEADLETDSGIDHQVEIVMEDEPVLEVETEMESEFYSEEEAVPDADNSVDGEVESDEPILEINDAVDGDMTMDVSGTETVAEDVTPPEAVQYEQVDQMTPEQITLMEKSAIDNEIFRYRHMLEINPIDPESWDHLAGLYKSRGRFDDAVEAYQRAISIDQTNSSYHYHLGLVYTAQRRIEDAISTFERVIEIDPKHGLAHAAIGGYHRRMGREELAQSHIEKAMSLMSGEENEYNHACLEALCGNFDRAFELLEIALKNKQTAVSWMQWDPDLDFIRNDPRFDSLLMEYGTVAQAL